MKATLHQGRKEIKILIVEDEVLIAETTRQVLLNHGYDQVYLVYNSTDFLQLAREQRFDLILMDIFLGDGISGVDLIMTLKKEYQFAHIYITAYSDSLIYEQIKDTEPDGFITKPFSDRDLLTTIEIALQIHAIRQVLTSEHEYLETILNTIGEAIIVCDPEGRVNYLNNTAETLLQRDLTFLRGKKINRYLKLLRYEDGRRVRLPLNEIREYGNHISFDRLYLLSGDDTRVPIACSMIPMRKVYGRISGILFTLRDISQEIEYLTRIEDSERKYRLLVETADDFIFAHDMEGRILFFNQIALEKTGYTPEEVRELNIIDILPPEERAKLVERRKLREQGIHRNIRYRTKFIDKKGNLIPVEVSSTPIIREGDLEAIFIIARDVQHLEKLEKDLQQEIEIRNQILSNLDEKILCIDIDYNIQWTNRSLECKTRGEISPTGQKCYNFFYGLNHVCPGCPVEDGGRLLRPKNKILKMPDGSSLSIKTVPIFGIDNQLKWIINITTKSG